LEEAALIYRDEAVCWVWMAARKMRENRWYQKGIRFECRSCGDCCRTHGDYAYVFLADRDVDTISKHLRMTCIDFLSAFCATDKEGCIYLKKVKGDCDFLEKDGGCRIYDVRPKQCEAWPFWTENMEEDIWKGPVKACCPGIGKGRRFTADEIDEICKKRDDWYEGGIAPPADTPDGSTAAP
jgi:Fe-S-cluster containining protein